MRHEENLAYISSAVGAPIDRRSTAIAFTVGSLSELGIEICPTTVSRLRSTTHTKTSGESIARRLRGVQILESQSVMNKDRSYLEVAQTGVGIRSYQQRLRHRLDNRGYTISWAEHLGVSAQHLRRCLRVMRVEMALAEAEGMEVSYFFPAARDYLHAYTTGEHPSKDAAILAQAWDGRTIKSFYREYYGNLKKPSSLKTWLPYEVVPLSEFYAGRIAAGSIPSCLDKKALADDIQDQAEGVLAQELRAETGIKVDPVVIYTHLQVLRNGCL